MKTFQFTPTLGEDLMKELVQDIWIHKQVFLQKTRHVVWNKIFSKLDQDSISRALRLSKTIGEFTKTWEKDPNMHWLPWWDAFLIAGNAFFSVAELSYICEYVDLRYMEMLKEMLS